jgi:hypothetical protein
MSRIHDIQVALARLAEEHSVPLFGFASIGANPTLIGDASVLSYPSLVQRMFSSADDIDRLRAQLAHLGSPRIYSQGETAAIFGLLTNGLIYGLFVDSSRSAVEQFRLASSIHAALTTGSFHPKNEDTHDS